MLPRITITITILFTDYSTIPLRVVTTAQGKRTFIASLRYRQILLINVLLREFRLQASMAVYFQTVHSVGYWSAGHFMPVARQVSSYCWVPVSYTHLRAHETDSYLVCRLLLEKK